jgi:hypothetical protein
MNERWANLSYWQLREMARIIDMAEHQAMHKHAFATQTVWKLQWSEEVRNLANLQKEIRELESCKNKRIYEYVP